MVAKGKFAMRPGLTLREDYDAARLRGVARRTKSAAQGRRLLALAEIYDGGSRTKAACVGGVGLQTIRDWVLRFNAHGPEGLADRQAPGHPGKLNTAQREALAAMVASGPMPAIHGVVRWRLKDLAMWVWEEFRVSVSETTLSQRRASRRGDEPCTRIAQSLSVYGVRPFRWTASCCGFDQALGVLILEVDGAAVAES